MAKQRTNCSCPSGGEYYCEWCISLAAKAGLILTPPLPLLYMQPAAEPEGAFMERLRKLAVDLGYLWYHTYSSKRSTPGWPDCALIQPEGGILHLWELKATGGTVTPAQRRWLHALERVTSVDAMAHFPEDWPSIVERLKNR